MHAGKNWCDFETFLPRRRKYGKIVMSSSFLSWWWTAILCAQGHVCLWETKQKMCGTSGNHGPEISHDFLLRQCLFWIFCLYIKTAAETVTIVAMQCIYHCFLFHSLLHCVFLFVRYVCGWHKNGVFVIKKCSIRLGTELDKSWENIKTEEEVNFQSSTVLIYSTKYKRRHPTSWKARFQATF